MDIDPPWWMDLVELTAIKMLAAVVGTPPASLSLDVWWAIDSATTGAGARYRTIPRKLKCYLTAPDQMPVAFCASVLTWINDVTGFERILTAIEGS